MNKIVANLTGMALLGALLAFSGQALAAGESSGDASTNAKDPAAMAKSCKDGEVWDPDAKRLFGKGKCVAAAEIKKDGDKKPDEKQGLIYEHGKRLAKAGQYERALRILAEAPDQGDPRVLNYKGFSSRKLGRMDEALGYYHAAIAANPDFSLVREYLGEAYIQLGMLEAAREQLTEIERICGNRSCGEYGQLAELMVSSQTGN